MAYIFDYQVATTSFALYLPVPIFLQLDDVLRNGDVLPYEVYKGCLKMDGQTLINLEVFNNSADGGTSGKFSFLWLKTFSWFVFCYFSQSIVVQCMKYDATWIFRYIV